MRKIAATVAWGIAWCRSFFRRGWGPALVLTVGGVLSLLAYAYIHRIEENDLREAISARAQERVELLRTTMLRSMEVLHGVGAMFGVRPTTTRDEFRTFVSDMLARQPELQALGWTPHVSAAERSKFEATVRTSGVSDFHLTELDEANQVLLASERDEYLPVLYIEPEARNRAAIGFDLNSNPQRSAALKEALRTGSPVSTPLLHLIQQDSNYAGFVVYQAFFESNNVRLGFPRKLLGYTSAVFRVRSLLERNLADLDAVGLPVEVLDDSAGQSSIYASKSIAAGVAARTSDNVVSAGLEVAGRQWSLRLHPSTAYFELHAGKRSVLVLLLGLGLTMLVASYLYAGLVRTEDIERRVIERTAQLSAEVAERQRAEEAARIAEIKFRSIVENSIEGIFQTSPDGHYLSANRSLASIYGYESAEHLMRDLGNIAHQLYVDPDRRQAFIALVQSTGEVSGFESQVYRRDRSVIWISENARAVRDHDGNLLYYEGMVVDITHRRQAEEELRRAKGDLENRVAERTQELAASNEALHCEIVERKRAEEAAAAASRAKGNFLANMSHEIRTPMNAILGYAQLLNRDSTLQASQKQALNIIEASGDHLLELIDDILDLSKIEAGFEEVAATSFNLAATIEDVAAMFRNRCAEKQLRLTLSLQFDSAVNVTGDERKLRQVLINLLSNAIKFTDIGEILLRVERQLDRVRFEIADTGPGIAADAQRRIFEPFEQLAEHSASGGSGLGLAIARRYVAMMGGELACASHEGSGSTFYFDLPLAVQVAAATDAASIAKNRPRVLRLSPGQIVSALVVDDVAENREVLAQILVSLGCRVRTAGTGAEALEMLAWHHDDVIFLDIMMPDIDGTELVARIHHLPHLGETKCVATTASVLAHQQVACRQAGFDEVIAKPIRFGRVCECLASLLGVHFDHDESPVAGAADNDGLDEIAALPHELRRRLNEAAELHDVTQLKELIAGLEQSGVVPPGMVKALRSRVQRYDLSSIAAATVTAPAAPDPQAYCAN
ncbi:hypothetical protein BH10PLA1_BH10PLA1_06300 [soil metagenome]